MQFRFEDNVYEGEDVSAIAIATDKYTENSVGYVDLEIRLENSKEKIPVTGSATVRMNTE
jgi:hypothetical protein